MTAGEKNAGNPARSSRTSSRKSGPSICLRIPRRLQRRARRNVPVLPEPSVRPRPGRPFDLYDHGRPIRVVSPSFLILDHDPDGRGRGPCSPCGPRARRSASSRSSGWSSWSDWSSTTPSSKSIIPGSFAGRNGIAGGGRRVQPDPALRPILMSATLFGLVPMALGLEAGAEMMRPLAITVIGGLTVSTFLTLILIPVLYEAVRGRKERKGTGEPREIPHRSSRHATAMAFAPFVLGGLFLSSNAIPSWSRRRIIPRSRFRSPGPAFRPRSCRRG